jgi:hypothetical protein
MGLLAAGLGLARPATMLAESQSTYTKSVEVGAARNLSGGGYAYNDVCNVGFTSTQEQRCAIEFDISNMISSAKVLAATLSLKRTSGCAANNCPVDLAIFTGNGSPGLDDVTAGGVAATFSPNSTKKSFNILGYVQSRVTAGDDYLGVRLSSAGSTSTPTTEIQTFGYADFELVLTYVNLPVSVSITLGGLGTGTVTSDPAGIDCPGTCEWWFEWTEPLTLTATPLNGGTFNHWEGGDCDGSTSPVCSFNVPATFFESTAVFDPISAPISPPPGATPAPTPTQLTPPPLPTARSSSGPAPTALPAPTDVVASDGTIITPPPPAPTLAPGATSTSAPAPTIVGLGEGGSGDAGASGGIGLPVVILLILVLGGLVGGGVYWFTKRRQAAAP